MLPYFNSGVIAVQKGLGFADVWAECCRTIDAETSITNKRPWLDQIALPIAVAKLNLAYECLDERFNYPAHLKPLPKSPDSSKPFLCHYHSPSVLRREPQLNQLVMELVETYPILKTRLLDLPEWVQLLKPSKLLRLSKHRRFQPEPEAIITGIPRSGTSYLCRLLHTLSDCVVINEPPQIMAPLANESRPWQIATFYQALRRDILDGEPIENKRQNGQVIEDTAVVDIRTHYQPTVSRADFLLCTKNTLAYLSRLPQLKQVMPHAPIIACVRNPLDTIASWKSTFSHLKHAAVTDFPVGHVNDPFLSPWQRDRLAEIATAPKDALKRALLWHYLAECILTDAPQLIVVHYEELVLEPAKVLQTLLDQIPNAPPLQGINKITPSTVRQKREVLDTDDIQAIHEICSQYAAELGYTFSDLPKSQVGWVERS
jgi:predicted ATPase